MSKQFFEAPKATVIYVFRVNDMEHSGCLKIGETSLGNLGNEDIFSLLPNSSRLNEAAHKRISQCTQPAAVNYELLYTELALFRTATGIGWFNDKDVHSVLLRSGVQRMTFGENTKMGKEWFVTDLETVKRAIQSVKSEQES